MVKTLKNLLLQNQESFEAKSCYIAFRTQVYQVCSNDNRRFLWQDQICVPMHLYGENIEKSVSQDILKTVG